MAIMNTHLFLIGPMGAGKSAIGAHIARQLSASFVDLDAFVETTVGASPARILREQGEPTFRDIEQRALRLVVDRPPSVIACGGGTPLSEANWQWMRATGMIVYLRVDAATAAQRLEGRLTGRPLLSPSDPWGDWQGILDRREWRFLQADLIVDGREAIEACEEEILAWFRRTPQRGQRRTISWVYTDPQPYEVLRTPYDAEVMAAQIGDVAGKSRVLILVDRNVQDTHNLLLQKLESELEWVLDVHEFEATEANKSLLEMETVADDLIHKGLSRDDTLLAIGGGLTLDFAGFLAATLFRGLKIIYMPTSLLAQVDACVGGKTAVNLSSVRNGLGVIRQPASVLVNHRLLESLPAREWRAGVAEVIKVAVIADSGLFDELEAHTPQRWLDMGWMETVVDRVLRHKARIVEIDPNDQNERLHLNLGHTFGHALEKISYYETLLHGEAVALGMMMAAQMAEDMGWLIPSEAARLRLVCQEILVDVPAFDWDVDGIVASMYHDKKRLAQSLRLILPKRIGETKILDKPNDDLVRAAVEKTLKSTGLVS